MRFKNALVHVASLAIAGCMTTQIKQDLSITHPVVRLFYTPLPIIGFMAVHPWFITHENGVWNRWEVWHVRNAHNEGLHVYNNLFDINFISGWGHSWLETEWTGSEAIKIMRILSNSKQTYPHRCHYWPWPGPNSNSYVTWVLRKAGLEIDYPIRALGSEYCDLEKSK